MPELAGIRSNYKTRGEPLRSVAERFDVPFSTLGKRAVREKWQRSVPPNGNKDGNNNTVFPEIGNKNGNKSGNKNGNKHVNSEVLFPSNGNRDGNKTAVFPEIGNKIGNSEALFPSNNTLAAKNGSAGNEPAAKSGSKNGSNTELAAKNGSAWNDPAAKSGSKNGSNIELAAKNGSAWNDPAAKSGSKNGSSFHIPADINEWDRLTAALFYLRQFHWAVHHLFQPTKGEDKEQGKRPLLQGLTRSQGHRCDARRS